MGQDSDLKLWIITHLLGIPSLIIGYHFKITGKIRELALAITYLYLSSFYIMNFFVYQALKGQYM
jgi:hypothetical protein